MERSGVSGKFQGCVAAEWAPGGSALRGEYQLLLRGLPMSQQGKERALRRRSHCQIKLSNRTQTTASTLLCFTLIYHFLS